MALANILLWLFPTHDATLASPTAPEDHIRGGAWPVVQGTPLAKVEGSGWAPIRSKR